MMMATGKKGYECVPAWMCAGWVIQKNHERLCCLNVPLAINSVTLPWKILTVDWYGARWRRSAYVRQLVALIRAAWNESVLFCINKNAPGEKYNKILQLHVYVFHILSGQYRSHLLICVKTTHLGGDTWRLCLDTHNPSYNNDITTQLSI